MVNSENKGIEKRKKNLSFLYEVIFVTLIFAGAFIIRMASIRYSTNLLYGNLELFENAKISNGVQHIFGLEKLPLASTYSYLLSVFFTFLGNKAGAVLTMNLILQMLTLILLFSFCRSLFGRFIACVTSLFYAGLPFFFEQIHGVTYEHILVLCFVLELLIITMFFRGSLINNRSSLIWIFLYFVISMVIGFFVLLDASLVIGLFFLLLIIIGKRKATEAKLLRNKLILLAIVLAGSVAGFALGLWLTSLVMAESITKTVNTYVDLYFSDVLFWIEEKMRLNYLAGLLIIAFAVHTILRLFERTPEQKITVNEPTVEVLETSADELIVEEVNPVSFIPNPLPVPKKHIKKDLDYRVQVTDDKMHYDLNDFDDKSDFKYNN